MGLKVWGLKVWGLKVWGLKVWGLKVWGLHILQQVSRAGPCGVWAILGKSKLG